MFMVDTGLIRNMAAFMLAFMVFNEKYLGISYAAYEFLNFDLKGRINSNFKFAI
jgi:hypothetical protein